ncbi:MAG: hypothetical protein K0Q94_3396 [Paenibacillus sp.]|jgi:RNA polymerase sigma factor (sigma-70 family)|nr:hypothetical protein [Paenibacillus sp.]
MKSIGSFTDSEISEYSKKIFGFALRKTGNHHHAEDLTQEILLSLLNSLQSARQIDKMEAWVHTICCYTWSNYLSKEKRYWRTYGLDGLELEDDSRTTEEEHEWKESLERLRREMSYLGRLHRNISVMYYYGNKSVKTISDELNIPIGTVKWHLHEARGKMKEAMNMEQGIGTLSLKPVRLMVGHCGSPGPKGEPNNYFDTLLSQNIAIAAYEQPMKIEEIARTLGVSSAYVEDTVRKLEYSDLIRKAGKDKYQTNFIIADIKSSAASAKYLKAKAEETADLFFRVVTSRLEEWKAIGFHGSRCGDAFLLWAFIPYAINYQYNRVKGKEYYAQYRPDERKDGGKYIVQAAIQYEDREYQANLTDFTRVQKYGTNGVKSRNSGKYSAIQMETWWSGMKWRDFNAPDIVDMHHIIQLMESGASHTEYDKELISRMVRKGFVSAREGTLECLIPFFKPDQYEAFIEILESALQEIGAQSILEQVHDDFIGMWQSFAPRHISNKEIVFKAMNDGGHIVFAMLESMVHQGLLPLPTEEEKERLTTLMWIRR